MTSYDVFIWELLDRSPFLRSYLTDIEKNGNIQETVVELLEFYRELDEMIDAFRQSANADQRRVVSGERRVASCELRVKEKVISKKNVV